METLNLNKTENPNNKMLTIKQAAESCGVSVDTFKKWLANEKLPTLRLPGSGFRPIVRINETDLKRWQSQFDSRFQTEAQGTLHLNGRRFIKSKNTAKSGLKSGLRNAPVVMKEER